MLCAAGAIVVCACLFGAGQQRKLNEADMMVYDAYACLAEEQTPQEFAYHYEKISAEDPARAWDLAVNYFWLAEDEDLLEELYAEWIGQGWNAPKRGGAVTTLTVTEIRRGPTAFHLKIEWPTQGPGKTEFPAGAVDVMFNLGFNPIYWAPILWDVPVTPGLGEKYVEVPYSAFHLHVGGVPPAAGFFKVRPSCPFEHGEGHIRGNWDWDDGGVLAAPLTPAPYDEPAPWDWIWLQNKKDPTTGLSIPSYLKESIPVDPGRHYLIAVNSLDGEALVHNNGGQPKNTRYAWSVTVPGMTAPLTGSTDTPAHAATAAARLDVFFLDDFWLVSIPTNAPPGSVIVVDLSMDSDVIPWNFAMNIAWLDVHVLPINLQQGNMPENALQDPPGSTDNASHKAVYLSEGGTAFITGEPKPPALRVNIPPGYIPVLSDRFGLSLEWRMTVETERPDYRNRSWDGKKLDDRVYPTNGTWHAYSDFLLPLDIPHEMTGNEIIGGKCALQFRATDVNGTVKTNQFNFFIRGMNPKDEAVTNYIHDLVCAAPTLGPGYSEIARKIAQHESKQLRANTAFNQFNSAGSTVWLPNKTDDMKDKNGNPVKQWGWGIFQDDEGALDNPTNKNYVTTASVFNWQTNCIHGVNKLAQKKATHIRFMGYFQNDYETVPPQNVPDLFGGWQFTTEQFGTVVLFNGADEEKIPVSEYWAGFEADGITPIIKGFRSPVAYNLNGNHQWTYHDNRNNYAERIGNELNLNWTPKE
jgi:hypothetical protein